MTHRSWKYALAGGLWGLPIPLVTIGLVISGQGLPLTVESIEGVLRAQPWQWLFVAHPLFFAAAFGMFGSRLAAREHRVDELLKQVMAEASTDPLTHLGNRTAAEHHLDRERARAARLGEPTSLLFVDVDHFKSVNDRYGHAAGDQVLAKVAEQMASSLRPYDRAFRFGGEEFLIVASGATESDAVRIGERVRLAVERARVATRSGQIGVTVSVGVAAVRSKESSEAAIARADRAMYVAKRSGRNRTVGESDSGARSSATVSSTSFAALVTDVLGTVVI